MSNFKKAMEFQYRSVYAILMRELQTRFGEKKIGFFWVIIEAVTHVIVFAAIKIFIKISGPDGINVLLFLITGIVPFFYFRNVVSRMMSAFSANKSLLTVKQISFLDFYYARFILETFLIFITLPAVMILGVIFIANIDYFYFDGYQINDISQILLGIAMLGLLGLGYGLIITPFVVLNETFQTVSRLFMRVLYFTSGVIISVDRIPYRFHELMSWNPFLHCMEYLRSGFFHQYTPEEHFMNYQYVFAVALTMIFIGLLISYKTKQWVLK